MEPARDADDRKHEPVTAERAVPAEGVTGHPHPATPGKLRVEDGAAVLALEHATKAFGAVQALADATIELRAGEAHALVGENGAGKSTLVKILAGVHQFDTGRLLIDGQATGLHIRPPPGMLVSPSSTRSQRSSPT